MSCPRCMCPRMAIIHVLTATLTWRYRRCEACGHKEPIDA